MEMLFSSNPMMRMMKEKVLQLEERESDATRRDRERERERERERGRERERERFLVSAIVATKVLGSPLRRYDVPLVELTG